MTIRSIAPATGPDRPEEEAAALSTPAHEPTAARALVPLEPPERISVLHSARPEASFVAHLIAMAELTPQTRTLRRATPAIAQAMYDRVTVQGTGGYGRVRVLSQIV